LHKDIELQQYLPVTITQNL